MLKVTQLISGKYGISKHILCDSYPGANSAVTTALLPESVSRSWWHRWLITAVQPSSDFQGFSWNSAAPFKMRVGGGKSQNSLDQGEPVTEVSPHAQAQLWAHQRVYPVWSLSCGEEAKPYFCYSLLFSYGKKKKKTMDKSALGLSTNTAWRPPELSGSCYFFFFFFFLLALLSCFPRHFSAGQRKEIPSSSVGNFLEFHWWSQFKTINSSGKRISPRDSG